MPENYNLDPNTSSDFAKKEGEGKRAEILQKSQQEILKQMLLLQLTRMKKEKFGLLLFILIK